MSNIPADVIAAVDPMIDIIRTVAAEVARANDMEVKEHAYKMQVDKLSNLRGLVELSKDKPKSEEHLKNLENVKKQLNKLIELSEV